MKKERNFGIDLLRILSMLYIVMLHYSNFGGIPQGDGENLPLTVFQCAVQMLTCCCVNCFALISGYVGYTEGTPRLRIHSYLSLWLEVVFYSLLPYAFLMFLSPGAASWKDLLKAFFPITTDAYWYFTAYTGLFFLIPLLNAGIRGCSNGQLMGLCLILCAVFTVPSMSGDPFRLHNGYTFAWLLTLYLLGAVAKKTGICRKISTPAAFSLLLGLWLLRMLWNLYGPAWNIFIFRLHRGNLAFFTDPSTLLLSLLHLAAFSGLEISSPRVRKVIAFAAPGTFAVYLLNTHPVIWQHFVVETFTQVAGFGNLVLRFTVYSILFVAAAIILDVPRQKLFRHLPIKQLTTLLLKHCPAFLRDI